MPVKLPPPDQMPAKKLPVLREIVLREILMIARYGAARVMSTNFKPVDENYGKKTNS